MKKIFSFQNTYYAADMKTILTSMDENMKELQQCSVLITGANGLIASYLTDVLMWANKQLDYDIDVYALCRNEARAKERFVEHLGHRGFHLIIQDVCEAMSGHKQFDYIIHAACNAHPLAYAQDPVGVMKSNLLGTMHLLDYAVSRGTKKFMFVSSSEVYGEPAENLKAFAEDNYGHIDITNPRSCYSESKRAAETLCVSYYKQFGLYTLAVRPGFIYGPAITEDNSRADAQFLRNVLNREDIVMKSKGEQYRSYEYVADAISAMLLVLLKGAAGEAYNIASDISWATIHEFALTMAKAGAVNLVFDLPDDVEKQGYSVISRAILSSEKIVGLGWKPTYTLAQGIEQTMKIVSYDDNWEDE